MSKRALKTDPQKADVNPVLSDPTRHFFENDDLRGLIDRATAYARAGVCVHLTGTAGLGKTTLAMRVAEELGQPISFMAGNEWLTARDFIGGQIGSTTSTVVDKYVHSVQRSEKKTRTDWGESVLCRAMEKGHTLVYDEFTRATPAANASLLSVLEEGILVSTDHSSPWSYLRAHPNFRVILTSNPHDYVGVNSAPDALLDRVVTLQIQEPKLQTMVGIIAARSALPPKYCKQIVELVLQVRKSSSDTQFSVLRSALLISRIAAARLTEEILTDGELAEIATDVLVGRGVGTTQKHVASALDSLRAA